MFTRDRALVQPGLRGSENLAHRIFETDIFLLIFGRTDPRIGASKAKNSEDVDFEVPRPPNLPKLAKKCKKLYPKPKNVANFFFAEK